MVYEHDDVLIDIVERSWGIRCHAVLTTENENAVSSCHLSLSRTQAMHGSQQRQRTESVHEQVHHQRDNIHALCSNKQWVRRCPGLGTMPRTWRRTTPRAAPGAPRRSASAGTAIRNTCHPQRPWCCSHHVRFLCLKHMRCCCRVHKLDMCCIFTLAIRAIQELLF